MRAGLESRRSTASSWRVHRLGTEGRDRADRATGSVRPDPGHRVAAAEPHAPPQTPLLPAHPPGVRPEVIRDLPDRLQVRGEPGGAGVVGHEREVGVAEALHHPAIVAHAHPDVVDGIVRVAWSHPGLLLLPGLRGPPELHEPASAARRYRLGL